MRSLTEEKTTILKVLADPSRYKILEVLINSKGNACVGDVAEKTNCTQSAVSHQLAKLESAGIVKPTRKGKQICYSLQNSLEAELTQKIMKILNNKNFIS